MAVGIKIFFLLMILLVWYWFWFLWLRDKNIAENTPFIDIENGDPPSSSPSSSPAERRNFEFFIFFNLMLVLLFVCRHARLVNDENNVAPPERRIFAPPERRIFAPPERRNFAPPERRNFALENDRARAHGTSWSETLLSFPRRTQIAGFAIRALPPVTPFQEDPTTQSQTECSICMEEFTNLELVQPFGVCSHQFHPSCINSWLRHGNTSCPSCRKELSITLSNTDT